MVSFDTNILAYATISAPLARTHRAGDLLVPGMQDGIVRLTAANPRGIQRRGNSQGGNRTTVDAWRAVVDEGIVG